MVLFSLVEDIRESIKSDQFREIVVQTERIFMARSYTPGERSFSGKKRRIRISCLK